MRDWIALIIVGLLMTFEVEAQGNTFTNNDGACWEIESNWQLYCIPFAEDTNWDNLSAYCYNKQVYYLKGTIFYMNPIDCPTSLQPGQPGDPGFYCEPDDRCATGRISWSAPTQYLPCEVEQVDGCGEPMSVAEQEALTYRLYCGAGNVDVGSATEYYLDESVRGKIMGCAVTAITPAGIESPLSGVVGFVWKLPPEEPTADTTSPAAPAGFALTGCKIPGTCRVEQ